MKNVFILLGTAVAWLLVSVDSHWNYGMYSLMRLFIAYVAIQALSLKYRPHILVIIALLYQPIFKIHLDRDLWQTVNVITAIYMIWLIIRIKFSEFCESVLFPKLSENKTVLLFSIALILFGINGILICFFDNYLLALPMFIIGIFLYTTVPLVFECIKEKRESSK